MTIFFEIVYSMMKYIMKLKIFIIPLSCVIFIGWVDPASDNNEDGIHFYNEKKYDESISKFTDAQSYLPESESLGFNIANAHYKEGKYPEAGKLYRDALDTKDYTLKAKANYNMGNTMYKQGKFKEALDFYKQVIESTEKNGNLKDEATASIREDAKYNYEYVKKKIEEMKQEQQERQEQEKQKQEEQEEQEQEQEQEEEEKDERQKDNQQPEEKDSDQQKRQQQQEKDGQEEKPSQENQIGQPPPPQPQEKKDMTREEAERLLDALKQAEMAARNLQEKEHKSAHLNIEKDW